MMNTKKRFLGEKIYRQSLTGDKLKLYNEKTKYPMRAYRQRQKDKGITSATKLTTRKQVVKRREYWRLKKREQRSKLSSQNMRRENEKRRANYAKKKLEFEKLPEERTWKSTLRMNLPKNPDKFVTTIDQEIQDATPQKKKALKDKGLLFSPNSKQKIETNAKIITRLKRSLKELKRNNTKHGRNQYQLLTRSIVGKYAVEHRLRKELNIKWEYWTKMSEIERNGMESVKRSDV